MQKDERRRPKVCLTQAGIHHQRRATRISGDTGHCSDCQSYYWGGPPLGSSSTWFSLCVYHFYYFLMMSPDLLLWRETSPLNNLTIILRWKALHGVGPVKHYWVLEMFQTLYKRYTLPFLLCILSLSIPPSQDYLKVSEIALCMILCLWGHTLLIVWDVWAQGPIKRTHDTLLCVASMYFLSEKLLLLSAPWHLLCTAVFLWQE